MPLAQPEGPAPPLGVVIPYIIEKLDPVVCEFLKILKKPFGDALLLHPDQ